MYLYCLNQSDFCSSLVVFLNLYQLNQDYNNNVDNTGSKSWNKILYFQLLLPETNTCNCLEPNPLITPYYPLLPLTLKLINSGVIRVKFSSITYSIAQLHPANKTTQTICKQKTVRPLQIIVTCEALQTPWLVFPSSQFQICRVRHKTEFICFLK